jgi:glycosyltransferase involved in cell wall biosynthesis
MSPDIRLVTVCVCTHNRPAYARDCLEGLERQTAGSDAFDLIVVDSGSTGDAPEALRAMVAKHPGARLIRLDQPGVSLARNAGARAARTPYVAYIDDDAIPAADWIASIHQALAQPESPALLGGRILPVWEAPLPAWWPASLRGVLSIIEAEGQGEYRTDALPLGLEPYAANLVVKVAAMNAAGGFGTAVGRYGGALLSDEEVQLAWKLQDLGHSARYDSRLVVHHRIQATRLNPAWLLRRLHWQGASTVVTRRLLGYRRAVWRELPRRLLVALLCAPLALAPRGSTRLLACRWRLAYALGFLRAALGWNPAAAAQRDPHRA